MTNPAIDLRVIDSAETNHEPTAAPRVLIVDDEHSVRLAISRFLRTRGYDVDVAETAAGALELLGRERFEVMLCDVRMPAMTGLELLPRALSLDGDLAVVMLTAVDDAVTVRHALGEGAFDYLVKPIELPDLGAALTRALHRRQLQIQRRQIEEMIRDEVSARTSELEQEKRALRELSVNVAEALTNAMEAKDQYLRGHSQRVADLSASIAHAMQLDEDTVELVRLAARVMDVGKIGIRETVMNKPGTLTGEEFEHVKDHVRIGIEILSPLKHLGPALCYVQDHHERMDGSGYPRGLRGEEISIGGRILAAADAYSALTSQRAFRDSMAPLDALRLLEHQAAGVLDPGVFAALSAVVRRRRSLVFIEEAE